MGDNVAESDSLSDTGSHVSSSSSNKNGNSKPVTSLEAALRNDCAVGHRVQASRSVLALALDEECVFAGLQGGDIVVR
jgi:di- and tripeptidase